MRPPPRLKKTFKPAVPALPPLVRPDTRLLTTVGGTTHRLDLPHGCFNAGLAAMPMQDTKVLVFRPDERSFKVCLLHPDMKTMSEPEDMGITNCADPRLMWVGRKLLMVYSSHDTGSFKTECIRGAVIMDLDKSARFIIPVKPFRLSPPGPERQKNWTPFRLNDRSFVIASVSPHIIYELKEDGCIAQMLCETDWLSPWFSKEFMRGNTNPVQLDDGNFLSTFHTVQRHGRMHYYDNGCYVFEGKPPFEVLRCSNRTFLPAEAAVEPHFRKADEIRVCFPVGMVRERDKLLISYGDNDSSVKILETSIEEMLRTTLPVY